MFALAKQSKSTRAWFKGFPYGHPDPTLPAVIFNTQNELFKNPDVRWALALLIDIKAVAMAAYRGAADDFGDRACRPRNASGGLSPADGRVAQGFRNRPRQAQGQAIRSDRRQADRRHAASLNGRADFRPIRRKSPAHSGLGWWKTDSQAAQELLEKCRLQQARRRLVHNRTENPSPFGVMVEGDLRPVMNARRHHDRAAMEAGRHRRQGRCGARHAANTQMLPSISTPS